MKGKNEIADKNPSTDLLKTDGGRTKSNAIEVPSIALPKGGGAIKGIDEDLRLNKALWQMAEVLRTQGI